MHIAPDQTKEETRGCGRKLLFPSSEIDEFITGEVSSFKLFLWQPAEVNRTRFICLTGHITWCWEERMRKWIRKID